MLADRECVVGNPEFTAATRVAVNDGYGRAEVASRSVNGVQVNARVADPPGTLRTSWNRLTEPLAAAEAARALRSPIN